jgi:hypothetical protein
MLRRIEIVLAAMLTAASPALAHGGGGGGGGHGGGYTVYIPVMGSTAAPNVPKAKTGDYSQIHKIAIVSAIGQTMTVGSTGLFAKHSNFDITDWKLDDLVETTVRKYIADRFGIIDVPYDRAALASIPDGYGPRDRMHAYLAALPAMGVDAFVVVHPDTASYSPDTPGLSIGDIEGISGPIFTADYDIDIVDAHSLQVIGHTFSRVQLRAGALPSFVQMLGPVDLKVLHGQTPTDAQRTRLKAHFSTIVQESLIETLRSLDLGIALPAAGARVIVPIPANLKPFANIKTVAIVSAVGQELTLGHRGAWFVHDMNFVPIADWKMDDKIEALIAASLDKRFTVKSVPADRAKIFAMDVPFTAGGLATPIDGLTPTPDLDAYIVVLKHTSMLRMGLDPMPGLGIWHQTPVGDDYSAVFANYTIALVDAHTLKPIWLSWGAASPALPSKIIYRDAPNSVWPEKGMLTPDQAANVRQRLMDELADSIPETLLHMTLTGTMVSNEPPPAPSLPAAEPVPSMGTPAQ